MRLAKFLGFKDEKGNPTEEKTSFEVGEVIRVFPRFDGYEGEYPWADRPNNKSGWDSLVLS